MSEGGPEIRLERKGTSSRLEVFKKILFKLRGLFRIILEGVERKIKEISKKEQKQPFQLYKIEPDIESSSTERPQIESEEAQKKQKEDAERERRPSFFKRVFEGLKKVTGKIGTPIGIIGFFTGLFSKGVVEGFFDSITSALKGRGVSPLDRIKAAWETIKEKIEELIKKFRSGIEVKEGKK